MRKLSFLIFTILLVFNCIAQTGSRVVAFARYGADTTLPCSDSGGYNHYSPGNTGEIQYGLSYFDCDYPFVTLRIGDFETGNNGLTQFDSAWEMSTTDTDISTQTFDADDNIIYARCRKFINGVWQNYIASTYTYDVNNNRLSESDSAWNTNDLFIDEDKTIYTYDANNRVMSATEQTSDTTIFSLTLYTYDANGNLIAVEGDNWNKNTSAWQYNSKRVIHYHNGLPDTAFLYDSATPGLAGEVVYYFSPATDTMAVNTGALLDTNIYDAHHNKTMTIQRVAPLFDDLSLTNAKTTWSYNAYGQVTTERSYDLDTSSGNWIFSGLTRFYYEPYETQIPFGINELQVFPSQAQDQVTIQLEWAQAQPFQIAVYDVLGRLVRKWQVPATQQYHTTLSVTSLAAGHYFIAATAGKQRLVQRLAVIH